MFRVFLHSVITVCIERWIVTRQPASGHRGESRRCCPERVHISNTPSSLIFLFSFFLSEIILTSVPPLKSSTATGEFLKTDDDSARCPSKPVPLLFEPSARFRRPVKHSLLLLLLN